MMKSASAPNSRVPFRLEMPRRRAGCREAISIASTIEASGNVIENDVCEGERKKMRKNEKERKKACEKTGKQASKQESKQTGSQARKEEKERRKDKKKERITQKKNNRKTKKQ